MVKIAVGQKCLVDTAKVYKINRNEGTLKEIPHKNLYISIEMDGFQWESTDYPCLTDFLQSLIDHGYDVAMGKK